MSKKHLQLLVSWEPYNLPGNTCKNEMQRLFNEEIISVAETARDHELQKKEDEKHGRQKSVQRDRQIDCVVKGYTLTY